MTWLHVTVRITAFKFRWFAKISLLSGFSDFRRILSFLCDLCSGSQVLGTGLSSFGMNGSSCLLSVAYVGWWSPSLYYSSYGLFLLWPTNMLLVFQGVLLWFEKRFTVLTGSYYKILRRKAKTGHHRIFRGTNQFCTNWLLCSPQAMDAVYEKSNQRSASLRASLMIDSSSLQRFIGFDLSWYPDAFKWCFSWRSPGKLPRFRSWKLTLLL